MTRYTFTRDVEEWILVEATSEEEARQIANETPLDDWNREVHDERTEEERDPHLT
jgi:hypothetical protein